MTDATDERAAATDPDDLDESIYDEPLTPEELADDDDEDDEEFDEDG